MTLQNWPKTESKKKTLAPEIFEIQLTVKGINGKKTMLQNTSLKLLSSISRYFSLLMTMTEKFKKIKTTYSTIA